MSDQGWADERQMILGIEQAVPLRVDTGISHCDGDAEQGGSIRRLRLAMGNVFLYKRMHLKHSL